MARNDSNFVVKNPTIFSCQYCDYSTSRWYDFNKHNATDKHKKTTNDSKMICLTTNPNFICECGNQYKHGSNFYRHKKKCVFEKSFNNDNKETMYQEKIDELTKNILDVVNKNSELTKHIIDLSIIITIKLLIYNFFLMKNVKMH